MTLAIAFALYAAAVGWLGPRPLRRRWAQHSPRLAITVWLVLPLSWVTAVIVAVLAAGTTFTLAWPGRKSGGYQALAGRPVPGGWVIAVAVLALAFAVVARTGWSLAREMHHGRRGRREHAGLIAAAGRPGPAHDVVILNRDAPAVYCLTSGRGRIVVSTGALATLTPEQIGAVLAHERAHLRSRHHAILVLATALARAFPQVPLLAQAESQLSVLAEMAADDAAARGHRRDDLAAALVILAGAGPRRAALTAGGPAAMVRLERLLTGPEPGSWLAALGAVAGLLPACAVASIPVIVAMCDLVTFLR